VLSLLWAIFGTTRSLFRTQRELALENLALRQQVAVLIRTRGGRRLRLGLWDRAFWVMLSQGWKCWREALAIVEPETVIRWHRDGFRRFWRRRSRSGRVGRPGLDRAVVKVIQRMAQANVTWGAPRIRNELAMLGIEVAVSTVAKYMPRLRRPPSQTWRAFLDNHLKDLVALDFFVVPTATFGILFGLVVLEHHRRRVVHFNVTAQPTAEWTARQLIQAFPEETARRFLVRDRDKIYGKQFRRVIEVLGIEEVVTAARSPWQNPYAERLIGSLRRDCLDHVIVLDQVHLRRILGEYFQYYNGTRCHLSLAGDAPEPRGVQGPELGEIVELPKLRGLHHWYERAAA
jgi:putative transposase